MVHCQGLAPVFIAKNLTGLVVATDLPESFIAQDLVGGAALQTPTQVNFSSMLKDLMEFAYPY